MDIQKKSAKIIALKSQRKKESHIESRNKTPTKNERNSNNHSQLCNDRGGN